MQTDLLDYALPAELIASRPTTARDGARLLVVEGHSSPRDVFVRDLPNELNAGDLVVVNDTRVIPARLLGKKRESGGRVELLLLRRIAPPPADAAETSDETWEALGRASKGLRPGARLDFGPELTADVERRDEERGTVIVTLRSLSGRRVGEVMERVGHVPLPPYLRRADDPADRERYQTVFARVPGAVAAPTAGLHLSHAVLDALTARGIELATVTLHVGLGTFQPVSVADLDDHPMHSEPFAIPGETVAAVARARARGARVVAIGTTVVRALESATDPDRTGEVREVTAETRLLIQPGYRFRIIDALVTNFHLPRSTLLALVCAFAGRDRVLSAYRHAIAARYRFYSYGDAMLLRSRADREP